MLTFYKEERLKETPIGKIPEDWKVIRLGDVAKIRRGASPRPKGDPRYFGGNIPWIKISDLTKYKKGFYLLKTDDTVTEEGKKKSVYLEDGSLIVSNSGTIGEPAIIKTGKGGCIHDGFISVNPTTNVDKYFLYYFFDFKKSGFQLMAQRGTQGNMNTNIWRSVKIPLPPLEEQKAIAQILSTVEEAIRKTNEIIAKTKRLKKGLVQELLTRGFTVGFMFDTNIFDEILDGKVELPENLRYYVTHLQRDEILDMPEHERERKEKLLKIFNVVQEEIIPTEGFVVGVSRLNLAKLMSREDSELYNKMFERLTKLDKEAGKLKSPENRAKDILIALTCLKNCLTLVTNDNNLKKVAQEFQCPVITFKQLLNGEYREFKDTEIGRIPKEWKVVKVGNILSLEYGKGLPERERVPGRYPVVGSNGIVGYHDRALVKGPGIVVGRKGTIGAVSWIDSDFWPIDTTYYVKPKISNISLKWLYYELIYLNPARFRLADVVPGLKRELVYSLKMSLPPLPEQQKIAEILSTVDRKLEVERKRKEKLERIKKGLMDLLLTGRVRVKVG